MPFTFKLSKRLALIKAASLLLPVAALVIASCDIRPRSSTGVDNPVAQIVVYPDTLTLDPQQSFQFRVFGRTQVGDSVPVSVRWETSAGTISAFGVYTADTSAADAVVTATFSSATVTGTSKVRKRRFVKLVINPKNTTLPSVGSSSSPRTHSGTLATA